MSASAKPVVALCMPRRGGNVAFGASEGFHLAPVWGDRATVLRVWTASSILDHGFNRLWSCALNLRRQGATHFAMIHDDICPAQNWLGVLLDEMEFYQADVMSAVVPIKSKDGLTSTALETECPWLPKRLTLKEVHDLPGTFTDADAGGELLLNSGLWLCDLRKSWVDTPTPLHFQTLNRLVEVDEKGNTVLDDNGDPVFSGALELQAQVRSEDWEFSRAARARGARLYATRKVVLTHLGEMEYPSDKAWGCWETDEIYASRKKREADENPVCEACEV